MALALFQRETAESFKNKKQICFLILCGDNAYTTKAPDEERACPDCLFRAHVSPMRSSFIVAVLFSSIEPVVITEWEIKQHFQNKFLLFSVGDVLAAGTVVKVGHGA